MDVNSNKELVFIINMCHYYCVYDDHLEGINSESVSMRVVKFGMMGGGVLKLSEMIEFLFVKIFLHKTCTKELYIDFQA